MQMIACLMLLVLLGGCQPDLPAGWEDAAPVDDFTQDRCDDTGGGWDTGWATMTASEGAPGLRVVGDNMPFRCSQEVEGFYRADGAAVDVLVQPEDMGPRVHSKCDCRYRIEAGIPEDPPATVSLYWRHDNINDENDPVLVGSVEVP